MGNEENRIYVVFEKNPSFFSLFPKFLLGSGFQDIFPFEEYAERIPDLKKMSGTIEHYKNEEYDIDVIYGENRIFLIIRTKPTNRGTVIKGLKNICEF